MTINIENLLTEGRNPDTMDIDILPIVEALKLINNEDKKVAFAIEPELKNIALAVERIVFALSNDGRLIYIGAGTSGRIGLLDAADCAPTYGIDSSKIIPLIAGGIESVNKSMEEFEDSPEAGINDLIKINFNKNDILLGIAASGRTPYVIGALEHAKKLGATTIALTCNPKSIISNIADISIAPITGAEVITGSSRMKAATAQKMILNMLTTTAMIRLGKVYQNLMVDLVPNNQKLVERQKKILMQATACTKEIAEHTLRESGQNVKKAIVMILFNVNLAKAEELLAKNHNFVPRP